MNNTYIKITFKKAIMSTLIMGPVLTIMACSRPGVGSNTDPNALPDTLKWKNPAAGAALTKDQAQSIKDTFKSRQMMILPPGELVFPNKNEDQSSLLQQEQQLKVTDPNSYLMLKDIQQNCGQDRPTGNFDATVPLEGIKGVEDLRTGDRADYGLSAGLNGGQCPVGFAGSTASGLKVEDANPAIPQARISGSSSLNTTLKIANSNYAQLLGARGIIINSTLTGLAVTKNNSGKGLLKYNLSGTMMTSTVDVPYKMTAQLISKRADGAAIASGEFVGSLTLNMPTFTATLDIHVTQDDTGKQKEDLFINGSLMTEQQISDLFGENTPAKFMFNNSLAADLRHLN